MLKELAVVQASVLSNSPYEWGNHGRGMIRRGGTQAQLDALIAQKINSDLFNETERLIIQFSTEITIDAKDVLERAVGNHCSVQGSIEQQCSTKTNKIYYSDELHTNLLFHSRYLLLEP